MEGTTKKKRTLKIDCSDDYRWFFERLLPILLLVVAIVALVGFTLARNGAVEASSRQPPLRFIYPERTVFHPPEQPTKYFPPAAPPRAFPAPQPVPADVTVHTAC